MLDTGVKMMISQVKRVKCGRGSITSREAAGLRGDGRVLNVVHFEICIDDMESAASFYSNVFGWEIKRVEDGSDYWPIGVGEETEKGIPGGLSRRFDELNSTINTIEVPSLDSYAKKITENGGKVLAPKVAIPGEGYVQYCHDLEGNTFGIMESDKSAQ